MMPDLPRSLTRRVRRFVASVRPRYSPPGYRRLLKRVDRMERDLANVLCERYSHMAGERDARTAFRMQEFKVFSQNGEDGLLLHIFSRIGVKDQRLVEIGIGTGEECNAANLILHFSWGGLLVDCDSPGVRTARSFYHEEHGVPRQRLRIADCLVTAENVNALLEENGLQGPVDLLSIDIDGNDYWVWRAVRAIEPRVVVIEYNASYGPTESLISAYDPAFDRRAKHPSGWYHSASVTALARLGETLGYSLVGCDSTGVNAFFVRCELAEGAIPSVSPQDAYYPNRKRLRRASVDDQLARLRHLEFAREG